MVRTQNFGAPTERMQQKFGVAVLNMIQTSFTMFKHASDWWRERHEMIETLMHDLYPVMKGTKRYEEIEKDEDKKGSGNLELQNGDNKGKGRSCPRRKRCSSKK